MLLHICFEENKDYVSLSDFICNVIVGEATFHVEEQTAAHEFGLRCKPIVGTFAQIETPYLYARSIKGLANGSVFVNTADVGGIYNGQWITAVSRWTTKVYNYTHIEMPKTGY